MAGRVTFVGAGMGDPRLLTLRAASVLKEADVVLFDPEVHPDVLGKVRDDVICHRIAPGTSPDRIGQLLAQEARDGKHVVRLAWADPLFFGTADVEAVVVARYGVPLEIVPGIGPLIAVGAFAGVPLTRSSDASPSVAAVAVTKGHESLHDWEKLAMATDTLAIVCDTESIAETARSLVFYGRSPNERVTIIENVSLPTQRVIETRLAQLPQEPRPKAARVVLVVGDRAQILAELAWLERMPLFGKRILVTRAKEQSGGAAALLRERGADPVVVPTIEIHPPTDPAPMVKAAAELSRYGWVVFTSSNGVDHFWGAIKKQNKDARAFGAAKIAAIGPGTASALEKYGLKADLVPRVFKGEELAEELLAALAGGKPRILVARAEVARDVVPDSLRAAGCEVDVVPVYRTLSPPKPLLEALVSLFEGREIDAVTFTSSSTVDHFCDALEPRAPELLRNTCVGCIGPITADTARKRGLRVDVTAGDHTISGLVTALEGQFDLATTGMRTRSS